ncbi:hypothetical protein BJY52DRAFT_1190383 [Lactarius psammicola]|nr:hypothetical protein BJY52DRAFT_1190383 [Lactarius psammicola]
MSSPPSWYSFMLTVDFRAHDVNLDSAPVREDNPSHAALPAGVLTPSAGILGGFLWPAVQRRLVAGSVIPLYGVIGLFAPRGTRWGLRVPTEIYMLTVYFGVLHGAFQS